MADEIKAGELYIPIIVDTSTIPRQAQEAGRQLERAYGAQADKASGKSRDLNRNLSATAAQFISVAAATYGVKKAFDETIGKAIEYEKAFTGVRKTVNATEAEFRALDEGLRALSLRIPVNAVELANIASTAGQLGIETKNIQKFSEVMAGMGVATNLSSTAAAEALARWSNITGLAQDQVDRLASVIVRLGNNMATTESDIVMMGVRLAAAGRTAGLTDAEIAALAASLRSVGLEVEAGGSAMSRIIYNIVTAVEKGGDKLELFGALADMTGEQFATAFKTDAAQAILAVVKGLSDLESEGGATQAVMEALEIQDIRTVQATKGLTASTDQLTDALAMANKEFIDNTALSQETERAFDTTASKAQLVRNRYDELTRSIGTDLLPAMNGVLGVLDDSIKGWQLVYDWIGKVTERNREANQGGQQPNRYSTSMSGLAVVMDAQREQRATAAEQLGGAGVAAGLGVIADIAISAGNAIAEAFGDIPQEKIEQLSAELGQMGSTVEDTGQTTESVADRVGRALAGMGDDGKKAAREAERARREEERRIEGLIDAYNRLADQMQTLAARGHDLYGELFPAVGLLEDLKEQSLALMAEGVWNSETMMAFAEQTAESLAALSEGEIQQVLDGLHEIGQAEFADDLMLATKAAQGRLAELGKEAKKTATDIDYVFDFDDKTIKGLNDAVDALQAIGAGLGQLPGDWKKAASAAQTAARIIQIAMASTNPAVMALQIGVELLAEAFNLFGDEGEEAVSRIDEMVEELDQALEDFGARFTDELVNLIRDGKAQWADFTDFVIDELLRITLQYAVTEPILEGVRWLYGSLFEKGSAFQYGNVVPFARGDVVSAPTLFPMNKGIGMMGESGPEAIMPLTRTSGGKLGVSAENLRTGETYVTVNNYAGVEVQTETRPRVGGGNEVMITLRDAMRQNLSYGELDGAMAANFGLRRLPVKR